MIRWILLFVVFVSGCGNFDRSDIPTVPQVYSLDAVKVIGHDISGGDPASYTQEYYRLHEHRRLLMRLETLQEKTGTIHITEEHRALLEITLHADEVATDHLRTLKLCPLTRSWMMLAAWRYAHPYGKSGAWTPGADYDAIGCITPTEPKKAPSEEEPDSTILNQFHFDISTWYQEYSKASSTNYGWILLTERPVVLHGDMSAYHSPRLRFRTIAPSFKLY